jgi:hypothetical protein
MNVRAGSESANIRALACRAAFGDALVSNTFRSVLAEAIVATALGSAWDWCSSDYAGWDFSRADGVRLEVKQSALLQTWNRWSGRVSASRFDIKPRKGCHIGPRWYEGHGRNADIYILAHHFVDDDTVDHGCPDQWRFLVIAERALPDQDSIGLAAAQKLATPCTHIELQAVVEANVAAQLVRGLRHRAGR